MTRIIIIYYHRIPDTVKLPEYLLFLNIQNTTEIPSRHRELNLSIQFLKLRPQYCIEWLSKETSLLQRALLSGLVSH